MKRNNLFMIAYIAAIFLGIAVKLFWDYPMWEVVVAAVTCSSACFSISDGISNHISDLRDEIQLTSAFSNDMNDLYSDFLVMSKNKIAIGETGETDGGDAQNRNIRLLTICRNFALEMIENRQKEVDDIKNKAKQVHHLTFVSNFFVIAGFFLFFCFTMFPELQNIVVAKLDIITVFSFAVILLTQYLAAWKKEKHFRKARKCEQMYDNMEKFFRCVEREIDYAD